MSGFIVENSTRIGVEIEPQFAEFSAVFPSSFSAADKANAYRTLNALTNVTLANSQKLEFVIDDVNVDDKKLTCQAEFRSIPISVRDFIGKKDDIKKEYKEEMEKLHMLSIEQGGVNKGKFKNIGGTSAGMWSYKPEFNTLSNIVNNLGLKQMVFAKFGMPTMFPNQATISVPLNRFLKLKSDKKQLIFPGFTGNTIKDFLLYNFNKIKNIAVENNMIFKTTASNRTSVTPNIKTGLDEILKVLNRSDFDNVKNALTGADRIQIQIGNEIGNVVMPDAVEYNRDYDFPEIAVRGAAASLTSEEKLKPLLISNANDIRVLVEFRKGDFLETLRTITPNADRYIKVLDEMDKMPLEERNMIFSDFFAVYNS